MAWAAQERAHHQGGLAVLRANGDETAAAELAARRTNIDAAIEANDYRAANFRVGFV